MSGRPTPELVEIELPAFGMPDGMPEIPASIYEARLERLRARMDEASVDRLVVYADREHSANLAYLTGFDPRFEEALLILGPTGDPAILVGNECYGMVGAAPLPMRRHRFQDLSLPGQPRDRSLPLGEILGREASARAAAWVLSAGRPTPTAVPWTCPRTSSMSSAGWPVMTGWSRTRPICSSTLQTGCA